jgi:hypothetical protein
MRPLRWKNQYATGHHAIDQRNKHFMGCLNQLMATAGQREHCQEMEQFLSGLGANLEAHLASHGTQQPAFITEFYPIIVAALPLTPYGTGACRKCGLCDLAQAKMAEHLQSPLDCLSHPDS